MLDYSLNIADSVPNLAIVRCCCLARSSEKCSNLQKKEEGRSRYEVVGGRW
ncbi:MAG: hypothetical protein ACRC62_29520 [Microcoleus sp.]